MTDTDRLGLVVVAEGMKINDALDLMRRAAVRSAFAINSAHQISGLITAYDIVGEKPFRFLHSLDCGLHECSRADVSVANIMEPIAHCLFADYWDLAMRKVSDVVAAFRTSGRTHIPVAEEVSPGIDRIRGMLSATEIARSTGLAVNGIAPAASFAEIERALAHGSIQ